MRRSAGFSVLATVGVLVLGAGVAAAADHSGTLMAVDRDRGTIVIGEVGPWQVKEGKTEITRKTIAVGAATQFVEVKLDPWMVREGDFVTVRVEKDGKLPTATKITVTVMEGG